MSDLLRLLDRGVQGYFGLVDRHLQPLVLLAVILIVAGMASE